MKIFIDTNILVFASINKSEYINHIIQYINSNCELLISDYIIIEYDRVINSKKLSRYNCINIFDQLLYKRIESIDYKDKEYIKIRDNNDYQVLNDAINCNADILLTNDKDFSNIVIDKPRILDLKQFYKEFMQ